MVISQVERHTGPIDPELIAVKTSRENNYVSVNITIAATGKEQLGKIFEDLKRIKSVKMVL
jgi:putative lipoic acid-binding regulatory protein